MPRTQSAAAGPERAYWRSDQPIALRMKNSRSARLGVMQFRSNCGSVSSLLSNWLRIGPAYPQAVGDGPEAHPLVLGFGVRSKDETDLVRGDRVHEVPPCPRLDQMAIQRHGRAVRGPVPVQPVITDGDCGVTLLPESGVVPELSDRRLPGLARAQQVHRVGQHGSQNCLEPGRGNAAKRHGGLHVGLLVFGPVGVTRLSEHPADRIDHVGSNCPHRVRIWHCHSSPPLQRVFGTARSNYFLCTGGVQRLCRSGAHAGWIYFEAHSLLPRVCTSAEAVTHTLSPCCAHVAVESAGTGSYRD